MQEGSFKSTVKDEFKTIRYDCCKTRYATPKPATIMRFQAEQPAMKLGIQAVLLTAAACWLSQACAQDRRTITHEDLWLMPRVGAPVISPDGKTAVISVIAPAYDPAKQAQDLWLVDVARGGARRLTHTLAVESGVSFSNSGNMIAFSTQRDGDSVPQIYTLSLQGGEAQRVTDTSHGGRAPKFFPNDDAIFYIANATRSAFTEAEQLAAAAALSEKKSTARVYEGFPIRYWDKWLDNKQVRPFSIALKDGTVSDLLANQAILSQPGYGGRFGETAEELDSAIAQDGAVILTLSVNRHRAAHSFTHTDLYRFDPLSKTLTRLTGKDGLAAGDDYAKPMISADGKTLLALRSRRTDKVYNANELVAFELKQGALSKLRVLNLPGRLAVSSFAMLGRQIYVSVEQLGREQLWQTDLSLSKAKALPALTQGVLSNLSGSGKTLIASYESATQPLQTVRVALAGRKAPFTALTSFGVEQLAQLDLSAAEHLISTREGGSRIHSMLIRPANFDATKKYPLLNLIHGGPHIMWRDSFFLRWNYHLLAQDKYVLLLTNYRGSTGAGEAFAQEIQQDPFKGPTADLTLAEDDAIKRFAFIDATRRCAGGASYGGHLSNWIQSVNTTRYRCLISHAGLVNSEAQWGTSDSIYGREVNAGGPVWQQGPVWREQNPIRGAASFKTPVLVTVGELDYRVPLNNTLEYWSALQRMQVPSRLVVFPDENHWILKGENSKFFYTEVQQWLQKYLTNAEPADGFELVK
jgi:dipeptidyl aminopeptidase/acylaminoacyl peptidase